MCVASYGGLWSLRWAVARFGHAGAWMDWRRMEGRAWSFSWRGSHHSCSAAATNQSGLPRHVGWIFPWPPLESVFSHSGRYRPLASVLEDSTTIGTCRQPSPYPPHAQHVCALVLSSLHALAVCPCRGSATMEYSAPTDRCRGPATEAQAADTVLRLSRAPGDEVGEMHVVQCICLAGCKLGPVS